MKGTDCTNAQVEAASRFLEIAKWPAVRPSAEVSRDQIARLLAWYGALRYIAGRDGTGGTLEIPGDVDVITGKSK